MENRISELKSDLSIELVRILDYWKEHTVDLEQGGFYGRIDHQGFVDATAPKGLVLNARILYAFSAGYRKTKQAQYLQMAQRAFKYLCTYFYDKTFGGMFWAVDADGKPLDTKKQVYGIAFCIYALSEYHIAFESKEALVLAKELYELLEAKSYDKVNGGYFEAFTQGWTLLESPKLSNKDQDSPKTMNTHLHVLEAYSNLYLIWPHQKVKESIVGLLNNFKHQFLSPNGHLQLFFSNNWMLESDTISYGHDIEASWLIWEAAKLVEDEQQLLTTKEMILSIAQAARKGLDTDGSLLNESNTELTVWNKERHWWQQAEAMVGWMNAWQLNGLQENFETVIDCWSFIKTHLFDQEKGEWFWGVNQDYSKMIQEDKAGFWKCPYHNTRMCIEMLHRLN
jgi:mannobiose 2-epimerase